MTSSRKGGEGKEKGRDPLLDETGKTYAPRGLQGNKTTRATTAACKIKKKRKKKKKKKRKGGILHLDGSAD